MDFTKYNRIIFVGSPGSGKSWLSKRVAEITGYPLFHLDVENWKPGWVKASREEQVERQRKIISGDEWIIDGNYDGTMELRFAAADLIVYLDMNRVLCIWSAAKRTGKKRSDIPDYLDEKGIFSKEFFEFSKFIWTFPKVRGKNVTALHEKYPEKEFLHIKSRREVNKILARN